jgi:hypothetical protein
MRNVAEYWYHRNRFGMHRPCNRSDYNELVGLLDGVLTHPGEPPKYSLPSYTSINQVNTKEGTDAFFTPRMVNDFRVRLRERASGTIDYLATSTISKSAFTSFVPRSKVALADIHAEVLRQRLPGFYRPNLSLKCKFFKSFSGVVSELSSAIGHNLN